MYLIDKIHLLLSIRLDFLLYNSKICCHEKPEKCQKRVCMEKQKKDIIAFLAMVREFASIKNEEVLVKYQDVADLTFVLI